MNRIVKRFREEAASISSPRDLKGALDRAMIRLDLPFFTYAWCKSKSKEILTVDADSFSTTITDKFFIPYMEQGLYRHDFSIYACQGTTTIPSLIGRPAHRWRSVPRNELSKRELELEDFGRDFFVDGYTRPIENRNGLFFAGASLIGQGMSMREFEGALSNADMAFELLRIYHNRLHELRQERQVFQIRSTELQHLLAAVQRGDISAAEVQILDMLGRDPEDSERKLIVSSKYEIRATVVNLIEVNNAPINIDARAVAVDTNAGKDAGCGVNNMPGTPTRQKDDFAHSEEYDTIKLHGERFEFGPIQASIIRILHQASLTQDPWVREKDVLSAAKSSSRRLGEAFKHHDCQALFESDELGRVRLRL